MFSFEFLFSGFWWVVLKKKNRKTTNPLYIGNFEIICGEASGIILLFLPHPAHILSAVGTKQEGEGSAPE